MKLLASSPARFLVSGAVNTLLTYLIYIGMLRFADYRIAYTVSYVAGIFISYVLTTLYVFKVRMTIKNLLKFPLVYLVQYLLGLLVMWWWVEKLGLQKWFAPIAVIAITLPVTFVLSRIIVGRKPQSDTPKEHMDEPAANSQ